MADHQTASSCGLINAIARARAGARRAGYYAGIITHTVWEHDRLSLNTIRTVLYALEAVVLGEAVARQAAQEASKLWWEGDGHPRTPERSALYDEAVHCARAAANNKAKAVYTALAAIRSFEWWVGGTQAADAADRLEMILRSSSETS